MLDREAQWSTVARRWLLEGDAEKPSRGARSRVDVAIRHLLGQGYGFYWWNRRFEPEEAAVLADAARRFLGREHSFGWAQQLLGHQFLRATPQARAVLAELHAKVEKGVESLPTAELQRSIQCGAPPTTARSRRSSAGSRSTSACSRAGRR
jgi:hypothetical protein